MLDKRIIEMGRKIVINKCYGGFSLSHEAFLELRKRKCKFALEEPDWGEPYDDGSIRDDSSWDFFCFDIPRDESLLVDVVKELGNKANGDCAKLAIVEIPEDVDWEIGEYDGLETVREKSRVWN